MPNLPAFPDEQLRVGYVAGYGRSGSTVIDIVLGAHQQVFGAGELTNLTRRVWPNNEYCSCGARVRDCIFWSRVVESFSGTFGSKAIDDYARLQRRYESLDKVFLLSPSAEFKCYCGYTHALFEIIARSSGKRTIVDSSKLPGRALSLMRMRDLDLRVVHLVRDGRGVAWSMRKAYLPDPSGGVERALKSRPVSRTALRWMMVNAGAEAVLHRAGGSRGVRVRYEDFVSAPREQLARLGELLGVDVSSLADKLEAGESFSPGHLVAGSRIRMEGPIRLRLDAEWKRDMPSRDQKLFQLLCGWVQRRYGYV
jgi:hypothetical protein